MLFVATTQVEQLFNHEDGEWRFVRGLTRAPKLVRPSAENDTLGVPSQVLMRENKTIFKWLERSCPWFASTWSFWLCACCA